MKKFISGMLLTASLTSFANTSTTTTTNNSIVKDKNYMVSVRRDLNTQIDSRTQYGRSGMNDLERTTLAAHFKRNIDDNINFIAGASFSKIDITASGADSSDYLEQLAIEGNFSIDFNDRLSGFAGLNLSKFTRMKDFVDADAGVGLQLGLQAHLSQNLSADLRYWETNNTLEVDNIDFDIKTKSVALGLSYFFN